MKKLICLAFALSLNAWSHQCELSPKAIAKEIENKFLMTYTYVEGIDYSFAIDPEKLVKYESEASEDSGYEAIISDIEGLYEEIPNTDMVVAKYSCKDKSVTFLEQLN